MPSFWNSRVLNGPVPTLVWPIDFASSIARLKASGVRMSGSGSPARDRDAVADPAIFDDAVAVDLAGLDELVELVRAERRQVPGRPGHDLLIERRPDLEVDLDLVAGRLFEAGGELAHAGRGRLVEQDRDLGGLRGAAPQMATAAAKPSASLIDGFKSPSIG